MLSRLESLQYTGVRALLLFLTLTMAHTADLTHQALSSQALPLYEHFRSCRLTLQDTEHSREWRWRAPELVCANVPRSLLLALVPLACFLPEKFLWPLASDLWGSDRLGTLWQLDWT